MSIRSLLITTAIVAFIIAAVIIFPIIQHALLMAFLIVVGISAWAMVVISFFDFFGKGARGWDS